MNNPTPQPNKGAETPKRLDERFGMICVGCNLFKPLSAFCNVIQNGVIMCAECNAKGYQSKLERELILAQTELKELRGLFDAMSKFQRIPQMLMQNSITEMICLNYDLSDVSEITKLPDGSFPMFPPLQAIVKAVIIKRDRIAKQIQENLNTAMQTKENEV